MAVHAHGKMASLNSVKSNSNERKLVILTLDNKLVILDHLKAEATQEKVADEYGIRYWIICKIGHSIFRRVGMHL